MSMNRVCINRSSFATAISLSLLLLRRKAQ